MTASTAPRSKNAPNRAMVVRVASATRERPNSASIWVCGSTLVTGTGAHVQGGFRDSRSVGCTEWGLLGRGSRCDRIGAQRRVETRSDLSDGQAGEKWWRPSSFGAFSIAARWQCFSMVESTMARNCRTGRRTRWRTPMTWSTSSPLARPRVTAWSSPAFIVRGDSLFSPSVLLPSTAYAPRTSRGRPRWWAAGSYWVEQRSIQAEESADGQGLRYTGTGRATKLPELPP